MNRPGTVRRVVQRLGEHRGETLVSIVPIGNGGLDLLVDRFEVCDGKCRALTPWRGLGAETSVGHYESTERYGKGYVKNGMSSGDLVESRVRLVDV